MSPLFLMITQNCLDRQCPMSRKIENIKVTLEEDLEEKLRRLYPSFSTFKILRKSIDARKKINFIYSVELFEQNEENQEKENSLSPIIWKGQPPIIVGAGPAGLFAALRFTERGIPCILIERGSPAEVRIKKINRFWRYGELDPDDNVCFGEGGAGFYSDGKLMTRIKSPHIPYVLNRIVKFGAPQEILWMANPHVGSDRIRRVLPKLRNYLLEKGCQIYFNHPVSQIIFSNKHFRGVKTKNERTFFSDHLLLAPGHSALDLFYLLKDQDVKLQSKSFALGVRVEHPQTMINQIQYREQAAHPKLEAATYQLTHHNHQLNVGVYSFCMCPGGYVVSSSSESDTAVCNGMSNYHRNSPFANSGVVVTIHNENKEDPFFGFHYARTIEQKARQSVLSAQGKRELPAQRLIDFLDGKLGPTLAHSSPSGVVPIRLDQCLPENITQLLRLGFEKFNHKMKGFISEKAQLYGVESRTSCPLRILRNRDTLESTSHQGLYPAGEGAGYAGGITSAACDGIRSADAIIQNGIRQGIALD